MIHEQDTQPVATLWARRPIFKQFRERYHLSYFEIARQAQVRPCVVYWMERGYTTEFTLALRILNVFSQRAGHKVCFEDMQGIHLKQQFVAPSNYK